MSVQKSVLITGCSAGSIGSSIAFSFAKRGLLVFATARNTKKLDPKLKSLSNVEITTLDVTKLDSISSVVEAVSQRTNGKLDYLINNSGRGIVAPFLDTDMNKARELLEVNFWGVLQMIQRFKGLLVEGKGTIVNVSSIVARAWNPYESIYNASKAAVTHFSDTLRLELIPLGVKVVTVQAGMVRSSWYENSIPDYQLAPNSFYHPVADNIRDSATGVENKKGGTDVDEFGEKVVEEVLKGKTGKIWTGAVSGLVWVLGWLPDWVMDKAMLDRSGLGKWAAAKSKSG